MTIEGLQKLTLLDYPGRTACTVFLGGCNFRCPFCHNFELAAGPYKPVMEEEELLSFLQKRQGLLDGVCFTGGEPLLRRELPALLRRVKELGLAIKLEDVYKRQLYICVTIYFTDCIKKTHIL